MVQMGFLPPRKRQIPPVADYHPSVDILIPIYSEPIAILEKTVVAALAINYKAKSIYVCDDSHHSEVVDLCRRLGVHYIKGPKKHAKAGNLNNALRHINGELVAVFDTDHVPVASFLQETVPCFNDPKIGFVQTPHHFVNEDIFQRTFRTSDRIPNEQDMFHHGILGGRDNWGGAFFVGSAAVFRRGALNSIGGFKQGTITEDVHTSQHLCAKGWKSAFTNKDLTCGLSAEDLSSYLVQRRRWMLGALQIFFKDNPLVHKGLKLRHRVAYFASLYYFFFPIAKVILWLAPLCFLLFHIHPISTEVSVLLGYLIPYLVMLPLIGMVLLPEWPRLFFGALYENTVVFQLFSSMFHLVLPNKLSFKVTPKGRITNQRRFDFNSSRLTILALVLSLAAITKGFSECFFFAADRDTYFFNLVWAGYNTLLLLMSLAVAWERPQRRAQHRVAKAWPIILKGENCYIETHIHDISLSGFSLNSAEIDALPDRLTVTFPAWDNLILTARTVYSDRKGSYHRAGFAFVGPSKSNERRLFLSIFGSAETWKGMHERHTRSNVIMAYQFFAGLVRSLTPTKKIQRREPRTPVNRICHLKAQDNVRMKGFLRNQSTHGAGVILFTKAVPRHKSWQIEIPLSEDMSIIHTRKVLPYVWVTGLRTIDKTQKQFTSVGLLAHNKRKVVPV